MKLFHEILADLEKSPNKVQTLQQNGRHAVKEFLRAVFDSGIQFDVKELPKYKPLVTPVSMGYSSIDNEMKRAYIFQTGHPRKDPNLKIERQQQILARILETLEPKEAEIFGAMILKKSPSKELTETLVKEAFPGLIP